MMLSKKTRQQRNQTKSNRRRLFVEPLEDRRMLAVIAVTTTADSLAADAACSLREAIINANDDAATHPDCAAGTGVDTIDVPGGTYALTLGGTLDDSAATGDLDLGDPLFGGQTVTIDGVGPTPTIIDATALGDRVFHVHLFNTATISDITIKGGVATDDGIALGTGKGGGIFNDLGTLTLVRTVIEGNTAVGDFGFGDGQGGGLYDSLGPATTIIDSTITGNSAIGGVDFSGTTGNGQGGGIYALGTTGSISGSMISGNTALGGTTLSPGFVPGQGGLGEGGGIYSLGSSWSMISGNTISGNFAIGGTADPFSGTDGGAARGAGIYSGGLWTAENLTISGNSAAGGAGDAPGVSGVAEGGGWFAGGGTAATISHLTIAFNDATGGPGSTGEAGGMFADPGGTVFAGSTIIAKNTASGVSPDVLGGFVSLDFNLIGDGTGSAGFTGGSDQVGTGGSPIDPLLGPLTSNGGPTETHALLTGSTAIDMADPITFPAKDQRGVNRPDGSLVAIGGVPDIGAYELVVINIEKSTEGLDADTATGPFLLVGAQADFEYLVSSPNGTFLGPLPGDTTIFVVDDNGTPGTGDDFNATPTNSGGFNVGDTNMNLFIDGGEVWEWTASRTVTAGQFTNIGSVSASDAFTGIAVATDADPSNHFGAVPQIEIEKLVSVSGAGGPFVDADSPTGPTLVSSGPAPEFRYEVSLGTGLGSVPLSSVTVTDSVLGPIAFGGVGDDGDLILEAGETWIYTATGTWAAGQQTNTGTATGSFTDFEGSTDMATDMDDANYFGAAPQIEIEKLVSVNGGGTFVDADSPTGPTLVASGPAPEFKFEVTRGTGTGTVDLDNVTVTDPSLGGTIAGPASGDDGDGILEAGETWVYFATGTWAAGQQTNTGSADGDFEDTGGTTKAAPTATDDANYFGAVPQVEIEKLVSVDGGTVFVDADSPIGPTLVSSGPAPEFKFEVTLGTGTGAVDLDNVSVTDPSLGGTIAGPSSGDDGDGILEAGETWVYLATGAWSAGQQTNTGSADGDFEDSGGTTEAAPTATDDANYFGAVPQIEIEKLVSVDGGTVFVDADSPTGPTLVSSGPAPEFKFEVTLGSGTGAVDLDNISVTDPSLGGAIAGPSSGDDGDGILEAGETWVYLATGAWAAGQQTNTGSADGDFEDSGGTTEAAPTATDDANYFGADPSFDLEKLVSVNGGTTYTDEDVAPGPTLLSLGADPMFRFVLTNTGNVDVSNIVVSDNVLGPIIPPTPGVSGGDLDNDGILDLGEIWTVDVTGTWSAGQNTNTGTASGDFTDDGNNVGVAGDTDDANYFGADPVIDIEKSTEGVDADLPTGPLLPVGSTADFEYVVTNPGNVPLSTIVVTDSEGVTVTFQGGDTGPANGLLDPGETWTYTGSTTVTLGQYMNTGTVTSEYTDTPGNMFDPTDSDDSHHLGVEADGEIDIEKSTNGYDGDDPNDPNIPEIDPGDTVTWDYKVSNPGTTPLANVVVTDDNGTPANPGDDFNPAPVLSGGFNVGDTNMDGLLDPGEVWCYQETAPALDLTVTIDFETDGNGAPLGAGAEIDDEYDNLGLNISATAFGAMIFDSDNPTGGDWDLQTPGYGPGNTVARDNILIISEDGDTGDPDDNASGGTFTFDWDLPVRVVGIGLLDIDCGENGGTIVTFDSGGGIVGSHAIPAMCDNSFQTITIGDELVTKMEVTLVSSGAITDLEFDATYKNTAEATADGVDPTMDMSAYRNPAGGGASKRFYVVDTWRDKMYSYDPDGTPQGRERIDHFNNAPRGVTMTEDGETLWVVDANKDVFVYDNNIDTLGTWWAKGLRRPEGIATDGEDIWIVDDASNRVFFYDDAASRLSGTDWPESSFRLAHGNWRPKGITTDGQSIWVVDDGHWYDKVFKYDTSGNLQGSWKIDGQNRRPRGITINPGDVNDVWIVDSRKDKVYEYQGGAFFTSGTHSADDKFRLAAGNRKPEGIADPPIREAAVTPTLATSRVFADDLPAATVIDTFQTANVAEADRASFDKPLRLRSEDLAAPAVDRLLAVDEVVVERHEPAAAKAVDSYFEAVDNDLLADELTEAIDGLLSDLDD